MPIKTRLFQGNAYPLEVYGSEALIDKAIKFFTLIECVDVPYEEIDFDFPDYVSSYMRVFNERLGRQVLELELERSGPYLIANASVEQMTFDDTGVYYYEIGYNRAGYDQVLRYGKLKVL